MGSIIERARAIADDVLLPAALATDASDLVPVASLDLLAREGFYGMDGPADAGGLDLDEATRQVVIETLASGCMSTTFIWIQHHSGLRAVAGSATPGLRENFLTGIPLGRLGVPDDIKGPALFLASDASAFVTGSVIALDGGNLDMNAGGTHSGTAARTSHA